MVVFAVEVAWGGGGGTLSKDKLEMESDKSSADAAPDFFPDDPKAEAIAEAEAGPFSFNSFSLFYSWKIP